MPDNVVNLRRARKRRARAERKADADANARVHGLSRAEKDLAAARRDKERREIDAHRRGDDE